MKERPILFSAPMIRAILGNRKDVTRRIIKPQPTRVVSDWQSDAEPGDVVLYRGWPTRLVESRGRNKAAAGELTPQRILCPHGKPGDLLWVKETWQAIHVCVDPETGYGDDIIVCKSIPKDDGGEYNDLYDAQIKPYWSVVYAATDPSANDHKDDRGFSWRPSIFMPRWASRITLELVDVRVERLQDITEEDAIREGVDPWPFNPDQPLTTGERAGDSPYRSGYALLWDEINEDRATWKSNPYVWREEFRRIN
jgi:hypothetical protein